MSAQAQEVNTDPLEVSYVTSNVKQAKQQNYNRANQRTAHRLNKNTNETNCITRMEASNMISADMLILEPHSPANQKDWFAVSTIDEGIVSYAKTEKHAEDIVYGLRLGRDARRQTSDGDLKDIELPEFVKLHGYGCAVTLRHGLLCSAPMAMDEEIIEEDLSLVGETSQEFLDVVNTILGTSFAVKLDGEQGKV